MGKQRNRRTQAEMLAYYQEQAARIAAKIEGKEDPTLDLVKRLEKRHRKVMRELRSATITLNGDRKADGSGWSRPPIDEKIQKTMDRLASQTETKTRAEKFAAELPFDVERLEAAIEAAKAGEDVEFPEDLTPLSKDENRTDDEHEAAFIAKQEEEKAGN